MKPGQLTSNRFNPADRTYQVSDERLRAFMALTLAQRLQWVEQRDTHRSIELIPIIVCYINCHMP